MTVLPRPTKSQIRLWKGLKNARARSEEGIFLAEGLKVVRELARSVWSTEALLIQENLRDQRLLTAFPPDIPTYFLAEDEWKQLSQDKHPEGIMAVASPPANPDISTLPTTGDIILGYRTNNPNNLGALMRTAHWFGFKAILLSKDSVDFLNPKVVRTSMGSLFHLGIIGNLEFELLVPRLKERYLVIAGDARQGQAPHACPQNKALLLGSESGGLPENLLALANERWKIPGTGDAESLSLPQAAAIMMYAMVAR